MFSHWLDQPEKEVAEEENVAFFLVRSEVAERSDQVPLSTEGRSHMYTSVSEKTGRRLLSKKFVNPCTENSERQAGVTSRCL